MCREEVKKIAKQKALIAIPDVDIGRCPSVQPIPLICRIFSPHQQLRDEAYVEIMSDKLHNVSSDNFESALSQLLKQTPEDEAVRVSEQAYADHSFLFAPLDLREKFLAKINEIYETLKVFASELKAKEEWENLNNRILEKVQKKQEIFVITKLLEYEALHPCSIGKLVIATIGIVLVVFCLPRHSHLCALISSPSFYVVRG